MGCRGLILLSLIFVKLCSVELPTPLVEGNQVRIAYVADGPADEVEGVRGALTLEILDLLDRDYDVTFSEVGEFTGNNTLEVVKPIFLKALDSDYDIIVTLGPISSYIATTLGPLPKPTIASFIVGASLQQTPLEGETSGVHNLVYITFPEDFSSDLAFITRIADVKRMAYLGRKNLIEAMPNAEDKIDRFASDFGITTQFVEVDGIFGLASVDLPEDIDAVYLTLLPLGEEGEDEAVRQFADHLIEKGLPSFSLINGMMVDEGLLMSLSSHSGMKRIYRRIALNVQRILIGQDPKNFSVYLTLTEEPSINVDTASALDLSIPFDILVDANIAKDKRLEAERPLSLRKAVVYGVAHNTLLGARWREVTAGSQVVMLAKSRLRPQIDVGGTARMIDRDRALASNGREPQTLVTGLINGSQMIYSNSLIGDYCIERNLQRARIYEFNDFYLDTVLEISTSYLQLLQFQTIEQIQRNNLALTRTNLMIARQRVEVGIARASEVYRWESEIARNRSNLVVAAFDVQSERTRLNRLLNRPQHCEVETTPVTPRDKQWLIQPEWFASRFNTSRSLENLISYSVSLGHTISPLVHQQLAIVAARRESLGIANRAFWAPDLFFTGEIKQLVYRGGAGVDSPFRFDDTEWSLALNLNFPFYDGGGKCYERMRSREDLLKALFDLEAAMEGIEQRIRVNTYQASSSFATIGLSYDALLAARKNLELVTNQYAEGTTSIIDLLDAQNQALGAELEYTNSIYGFLIDYVRAEREVGFYDFLLSEEQRAQYETMMEQYLFCKEAKQ